MCIDKYEQTHKFNELTTEFLEMVKSGKLVAEISSGVNHPKEQGINIKFKDENKSAYKTFCVYTKEWDYRKLSEETLLFKTNGLFTNFIMHDPNNTRGSVGRGDYKTTDGQTFNVQGGWSSRPGVVREHTGIELLHISMDRCVAYMNMPVAKELASILGLHINLSEYQCEGEVSYSFYKTK